MTTVCMWLKPQLTRSIVFREMCKCVQIYVRNTYNIHFHFKVDAQNVEAYRFEQQLKIDMLK